MVVRFSEAEFLKVYHFENDVLKKNNIFWEDLIAIYDDFSNRQEVLEEYANLIAGILRKQTGVHTVRTRIKDPEHLIAKLIRKTPDRKEKYGADFKFSTENYRAEITDLIGVRVIHIFKEDWLDIHQFISDNWEIIESQANVRKGDNEEFYTDHGIKINSRETGYRSVHYLIEFEPTKQKIVAEIQVRTIFEEGYGEIDHQLSYPNDNVSEVLKLNLLMLNRLAGSADEMATSVRHIKQEWSKMQNDITTMQKEMKKKENEVQNLKSKIENLNLKKQQKDTIFASLDSINNSLEINNLVTKDLWNRTNTLNNAYNLDINKHIEISNPVTLDVISNLKKNK